MSFTETTELAPGFRISRVIRGGWQLAGGHGPVDPRAAEEDLLAYFQSGITSLDCADIYTGVEELIGDFRVALSRRLGSDALARLKVHTKFVPDLDVLPRIDRAYVTRIIDRSLRRLKAERLDLVQFHWWDYAIPGCADTALWLEELRTAGKIDLIGGTNFDRRRMTELTAAGVPLKSLQVQYSLLDDRPARTLATEARASGVGLLCYGTLAGGFLAERWLDRPEPSGPLGNRSLIKYKLIIDDFGGWSLFQALLRTLAEIAGRHRVSLASVAARWVLDQPGVSAVIVGARTRDHLPATLEIGRLALTDQDRSEIAAVLSRRSGPSGEVYELERDRSGRHGAIMRYNLNA